MTKRRAPKAKRDTAVSENDADACPICLEEYDEDAHKTAHFPGCAHKLCRSCLDDERLAACPLCRIGRDGSSQQERQRREERQNFPRLAISRGRRSGMIVLPVPPNLESPIDERNFTISFGPGLNVQLSIFRAHMPGQQRQQ